MILSYYHFMKFLHKNIIIRFRNNTYSELRVLMMAEDDSSCFLEVNGPLFQPNIMKIRQYACFFLGPCDGNAKIRRNISQKSKNIEKLNFEKVGSSKFDEK